MASIEILIHNHSFDIRSDENEVHLAEVKRLVQSEIESVVKAHPRMVPAEVAILAAVEFSSRFLHARAQIETQKDALLSRAGDILERIERELNPTHPSA
jgi:cell division protein ZapA (FtsZ GTPase activity inhibitor)